MSAFVKYTFNKYPKIHKILSRLNFLKRHLKVFKTPIRFSVVNLGLYTLHEENPRIKSDIKVDAKLSSNFFLAQNVNFLYKIVNKDQQENN